MLFSTRLTATLFLVFAFAMGTGTFIESKYNTDTARIFIYNAWWFEAIIFFFMINFIGNIRRYRLWRKEKWATLSLHLAFVLIIFGAFITRYISYEGAMPIREGASENVFYSENTFLTLYVDGEYKGEMKRRVFEKQLLLSPIANNNFELSSSFDKTPFEVRYKNFLIDAKEDIKPSPQGILYLKMVFSGDSGRENYFLKEGEVQNINNILFSLNNPTKGAINIVSKNDKYTIESPFAGSYMKMADRSQGKLTENTLQTLNLRSLYTIGNLKFVIPEPAQKGIIEYKSENNFKAKNTTDALVLTLSSNGETHEVTVFGGKGRVGTPQIIKIGNLEYTFLFGSKKYILPFQIKLNDFVAKKYPGTQKSYSSFESFVNVSDSEKQFDYKIYMNHVLDYKGYRFFQSGFDPDEQGTILSVNHDYWGTLITYIGYFILFVSMIVIFFIKNSRFSDLKKKLDLVKQQKAKLISLLLLFGINSFGQTHNHDKSPTVQQLDSILEVYKVPETHAAKFGRTIIQDANGRMKPLNTFSSELLRKVSHSDKYKSMNSDQVFLSMLQNNNIWIEIPLIYIKKGNDSIRKIIGIKPEDGFAPFIAFFDENGNYKLYPFLEQAYKSANPNSFEKDFIETDKKVNLMDAALSGSILRIFPIPNDANNKWISYSEVSESPLKGMDSIYVKNILPLYFTELSNSAVSKKYENADKLLESIDNFQKKFGAKVRPSEDKITTEILYNKYDVLQKLPYLYLTAAVFMLFFVIIKIFKERKVLTVCTNIMHICIVSFFGLHTIALIARWIISGHAPWSNAYESIVYVAWATMFFGLVFDRKSKLTIASAAFVTAMILSAAYANWTDPEIANLQPVLNSYWLMIHVAIIVASYGPFALGMILGAVSLLLIFFTNENNKTKMELNIKELSYINEMSLTIGLVMLTIGNFLGGQWANESWGRYWGWDPKETWALISIMVYAFVIHARLVPALRGRWFFSLMSMYAFISILFTYYGVNFHLVGLHSYASGEAHSLAWIWYSLAAISLFGIISYPKNKKYYSKKN